jgi:hypothetical protein
LTQEKLVMYHRVRLCKGLVLIDLCYELSSLSIRGAGRREISSSESQMEIDYMQS